MPTPKAGWVPIQLDLVGSSTASIYATPGVDGKVVQITVGEPVAMTTGNVRVYKNSAVPLCSAVDCRAATTGDLVAGVAENATLTTKDIDLLITATDMLYAT